MASELQTIPLAELSVRITKGTTPTTLGRPFVDRGINFVKSEGINHSGRIDTNTFAFIDPATHAALGRSQLQEGDVLFSMAGVYLGKTAVVPKSILPANTNQAVGIIRLDPRKAEPRFVHYALSSPICRTWVQQSVAQSAQPNFNLRDIGNLPIPALSLVEQRAVAHILGTLDDRIELNRGMSETLEATARALFRSWFVDFDPVREKTVGCDPSLPKHLADLFPAGFVDSEIGKLPQGWRVGQFASVVEHSREQLNPMATPDETFHHFSIPAFDEGQRPAIERGEVIKSQKFVVPPDVILVSKLNPEIDRVWLVDVREGERAVCSTEFLVLRARPPFARSYAYCLSRSNGFRQQIESLVTGTSKSHQRARPESILGLLVVLPSAAIAHAFIAAAEPMLTRALACRRENDTLTEIREVLLPRLISREIRVKDAERFIARRTS